MEQSKPGIPQSDQLSDLTPAIQTTSAEADRAQATREAQQENVSKPGGFKNDPDDSTNPNEVIERHRRQLRP